MYDPIAKARQFYLMLDTTDDSVALERYHGVMERSLKEAGADYSVLDPTGERGDTELRREVAERLRKPYITKAQQFHIALDTARDPAQAERYQGLIRENLNKAGVDSSVLEPKEEKGDHTDATQSYITKARQFYIALDAARNPAQAERYQGLIRESLNKAGVGFSALDPKGEKGDHVMQQEVRRAADRARGTQQGTVNSR